MNQKFVKSLQFTFFLLVGIVLLYFAFRGIDLNDLLLQIRQADYRWVALSIVFAFLALVFRSLRWRLLIEPLDAHPKLSHILHAINIGYLANFVFPRIGEITRCGVLNRTDKIPVDRLFGTVIVERIFDLLIAILMLCLIMLLRFDVVGDFLMQNIILPVADKIPGITDVKWIIGIILLVLLAFILFYKIFRSQLSKISALRKIKDLVKGIINGVKSVSKIRNLWWFILLNILIFGMYFLQTYVLFFALKSTSSLGLADALFILVLSTLSFVIPVQGGIGAYHWVVSMGLTIFGLTREEGMVYATISHSVTSLLLILLGAISMIFVFSGKRMRKTKGHNDYKIPGLPQ